ncbi:hypothetical protein MCAP1_002243 [Malassezia caprae]|uniref:DASH complex subunit SPC19 n=1 Tax=Malassezia caprae TaxID=1381934 RepID=A0AAF0E843_9BASI|nr:hypothetical protein MCAP1_002243 [Malassezia caprae]
MSNQRHFDLVSEREVRQAREHVAAEIAPLLRELIMRAEEVLGKDEQKARALRSKVRVIISHKATEELAKVDAQAQTLAEEKDAALGQTASQMEYDAQVQELEKLRKQRAQLMEHVNMLEKQGKAVL